MELPTPETTLVAPSDGKTSTVDDQPSLSDMEESSSKLDALLHILEGPLPSYEDLIVATWVKDSSVKTVVFSQFTKFLDIIATHLRKRGYDFVRLDGSMTINQRDSALNTFSTSPTHTILLASLAVCSVGVCLFTRISKDS